MPVSGQVRCQECGHESDAQYRFCGMCGSRLPELQNPEKPKRPSNESAPARAVSGPSFLGLADEPVSSVTYLLEDDQSSAHWGRRIFALLFLAALATAAWHWREPLRVWAVNYVRRPASPSAPTNGDTTYKAGPISTSGSEVAGAVPNGAAINQTPAADNTPAQSAPTPQGQPTPTPPAASTPVEAQPTTNPPPAAAPQPAPQTGAPASPAQSTPSTSESVASGSMTKSESSSTSPAPTKQASLKKPAPGHDEASDQSPAPDPQGVALEAEGEKYLYGSGVPASCSHAQKSLLTAAQHANARAQSVLGTMYATGHCVTRDLPLAYSWFAKSMQQDPSNARVERNLLMVWNQMTPDERALAIHHK